jgi:hypothetical protein
MKFKGNLLVINSAGGSGAVIESPELQDIDGTKFIVGISVVADDKGITWTAGSKIWVALDKIVTITELSDSTEWRNRLDIHRGRSSNFEH